MKRFKGDPFDEILRNHSKGLRRRFHTLLADCCRPLRWLSTQSGRARKADIGRKLAFRMPDLVFVNTNLLWLCSRMSAGVDPGHRPGPHISVTCRARRYRCHVSPNGCSKQCSVGLQCIVLQVALGGCRRTAIPMVRTLARLPFLYSVVIIRSVGKHVMLLARHSRAERALLLKLAY
jgi:hypothetical protein